MAGTLEIPSVGEKNTTADPKLKTGLETFNNLLDASNKLLATSLATGVGQMKWYAPKVIATEQSRENVAFGTLTTADEVKEIVVPENGDLAIRYRALWKSSVVNAGRAAIFIGANQLKRPLINSAPVVSETTTPGKAGEFAKFTALTSATGEGLSTQGTAGSALTIDSSFVTTGEPSEAVVISGLPAGTYNISIQFKATSGNITVKERSLKVYTLGY